MTLNCQSCNKLPLEFIEDYEVCDLDGESFVTQGFICPHCKTFYYERGGIKYIEYTYKPFIVESNPTEGWL